MRTNLFRLLILMAICLVPLAACEKAEEAVEGTPEAAAEPTDEAVEEQEGGETGGGEGGEDEDGEVDPEGEGYDETGTGDEQ